MTNSEIAVNDISTIPGQMILTQVTDGSITYAKLQNVSATDKVLGRSTAAAGVMEEIACPAFGRSLIANSTASGARTTLGLGTLATQAASAVTITGGTITGVDFAAAVVALTDAASIAVDASLGDHFRVTLAGNRTLSNPTGATDGQRLLFELIQDSTGTRLLTLDTKFAFGTTITAVVLTVTASKRDLLEAVYNSSSDKFYVINFVKGY